MSSPQNRFLFYLFADLEKLIGKKEVFVRRQKVFHECDTTVNVCVWFFSFHSAPHLFDNGEQNVFFY